MATVALPTSKRQRYSPPVTFEEKIQELNIQHDALKECVDELKNRMEMYVETIHQFEKDTVDASNNSSGTSGGSPAGFNERMQKIADSILPNFILERIALEKRLKNHHKICHHCCAGVDNESFFLAECKCFQNINAMRTTKDVCGLRLCSSCVLSYDKTRICAICRVLDCTSKDAKCKSDVQPPASTLNKDERVKKCKDNMKIHETTAFICHDCRHNKRHCHHCGAGADNESFFLVECKCFQNTNTMEATKDVCGLRLCSSCVLAYDKTRICAICKVLDCGRKDTKCESDVRPPAWTLNKDERVKKRQDNMTTNKTTKFICHDCKLNKRYCQQCLTAASDEEDLLQCKCYQFEEFHHVGLLRLCRSCSFTTCPTRICAACEALDCRCSSNNWVFSSGCASGMRHATSGKGKCVDCISDHPTTGSADEFVCFDCVESYTCPLIFFGNCYDSARCSNPVVPSSIVGLIKDRRARRNNQTHYIIDKLNKHVIEVIFGFCLSGDMYRFGMTNTKYFLLANDVAKKIALSYSGIYRYEYDEKDISKDRRRCLSEQYGTIKTHRCIWNWSRRLHRRAETESKNYGFGMLGFSTSSAERFLRSSNTRRITFSKFHSDQDDCNMEIGSDEIDMTCEDEKVIRCAISDDRIIDTDNEDHIVFGHAVECPTFEDNRAGVTIEIGLVHHETSTEALVEESNSSHWIVKFNLDPSKDYSCWNDGEQSDLFFVIKYSPGMNNVLLESLVRNSCTYHAEDGRYHNWIEGNQYSQVPIDRLGTKMSWAVRITSRSVVLEDEEDGNYIDEDTMPRGTFYLRYSSEDEMQRFQKRISGSFENPPEYTDYIFYNNDDTSEESDGVISQDIHSDASRESDGDM